MDPKPASTEVDSKGREDMLRLNDFSVLTRFIYDTSSFSDRLVQLAAIDATTAPARAGDREPSSGLAGAGTADEKKDIESAGNPFYPEHLLVD
ncbi:hypothetical protein MRS44_010557 [Fusarium solani]|uniref:uncharacterized protein n=1 Tax=Fusarium solani TaxID=169388 RepID=UPI0032C40C41|nr:hypothetical protein MRS44_010557 [Fusarium solani]